MLSAIGSFEKCSRANCSRNILFHRLRCVGTCMSMLSSLNDASLCNASALAAEWSLRDRLFESATLSCAFALAKRRSYCALASLSAESLAADADVDGKDGTEERVDESDSTEDRLVFSEADCVARVLCTAPGTRGSRKSELGTLWRTIVVAAAQPCSSDFNFGGLRITRRAKMRCATGAAAPDDSRSAALILAKKYFFAYQETPLFYCAIAAKCLSFCGICFRT